MELTFCIPVGGPELKHTAHRPRAEYWLLRSAVAKGPTLLAWEPETYWLPGFEREILKPRYRQGHAPLWDSGWNSSRAPPTSVPLTPQLQPSRQLAWCPTDLPRLLPLQWSEQFAPFAGCIPPQYHRLPLISSGLSTNITLSERASLDCPSERNYNKPSI